MISILSPFHAHICHELHTLCFEKKWSLEEFHNLLSNDSFIFFGYYQSKILVGMVGVSIIIDQAEIYTYCTHPDYRKQKIASKLMQFIIDECKNRLITEIFLDVAVTNIDAISFYKRHDFQYITTRKNYYETNATFVDAMVMKLNL